MKYIVLIIASIMLFSCNDRKKQDIVSLINKWEGREISFPKNSTFTIRGKDTVFYSILKQKKILSYVDSIGCTSCKLDFKKWRAFMDEVDSISLDSIQFLFFFSPQKNTEIFQVLNVDKFNHPICIDEKDSLNKLNDFPNITSFQTFLLDENNRVLVVGNPIYNTKVKEIYINVLRGLNSNYNDKKELLTEIETDKLTISLGKFKYGNQQKISFKIINIGRKQLIIEGVDTSCRCIDVSYSKEPVCIGDSILLDIMYKAEYPEYFNKTITIHCNAKSSPIVLKITGNAE